MPLVLPVDYHSFRIISIDPGTLLMGLAFLEVDFHSRKILQAQAYTWQVEKLEHVQVLDEDIYKPIDIRIQQIKDNFTAVVQEFRPACVVCERPFFNSRTPSAFASILKVLEAVRNCIVHHNAGIPFILLEPMVVKKVVGAALTSDKSEVTKGLLAMECLKHLPIYQELPELPKDATDALAVGVAYLRGDR